MKGRGGIRGLIDLHLPTESTRHFQSYLKRCSSLGIAINEMNEKKKVKKIHLYKNKLKHSPLLMEMQMQT